METDSSRYLQQLEASEARCRTIIEKNADGIVMVSQEGVIRFVNPATEALLGRPAQELIGQSFGVPVVPGETTEVDILRSGATITVAEMRVVETTWRGEISYLASLRDVSERKRLEDELRQRAEQLAEADRRKDEFLATLAHELRNPLAPIRNGLQVMKMANGNAQAVEQARGMMERQLGQMVRLIDDLLDVSRITRGKLPLRKERIELASVVQSALESSRPLIEAFGHQLTVTLPSEPIYLDVDPTRLAQVFANLLTNAAKYTDRDGHIALSAERQGREVAVTVRDTGIGIAPEHLPRLFEMFNQAVPARERSQGGLGIGLSLVKGLVEMHGGTIEAHSDGLNQGSAFTVHLPLAERETTEPLLVNGNNGICPPRCRILVVDDNHDAAESLALILRLSGHEVHAAHDGEEAVAAAGWFRPDVAFLDIGMPRLNGLQAARRIRQQSWGKRMTLVAVTGWGQEEDRRRTTEAGFDHHLTKPVDPAAVEKLLADRDHGANEP